MEPMRVLIAGGVNDDVSPLFEALEALGASVQFAEANVESIAALPPFDVAVLLPNWRSFGPFLDTPASTWDTALEVNFERVIYAAQACARRWIAEGTAGRLIFVTGVTALMPFAGASVLGTTLAAVHAIARMAAVDLAPHGITSNVIAPGWMAGELAELPKTNQAHIRAGIPLARPAEPAEIASAITFLASEGGAYVTGAILPVDGGYTLTRSDGRGMFEA